MQKLIALFFTITLLSSCKPKLPDLILDHHFFVDKYDFMPEFGLRGEVTYSTPDGMYRYHPDTHELTIFSDLGLEVEHQEILKIEPETIFYRDLLSFGFRNDDSRFICFHHEYNQTKFKRLTDSEPISFEKCKKTIGLPYQKKGWGDIAAFILLILNKSEKELVGIVRSIK